MNTVVEQVWKKWKDNKVPLNAPLERSVEEAFSFLHGVELPATLVQLLRRANGSASSFPCEFRFLAVREYFCPYAKIFDPLLTTAAFVFLDYMDWSWGYAVDMCVGGAAPVYLVGTACGTAQLVAHTFNEFLELYVCDDARLYPSPTWASGRPHP